MNQRNARGAMALDAKWVTSPDVARREAAELFPRHWSCAGHVSELFRDNNQVTVSLAGNPLVLTRDDSGAVRGFHNVCRHRGAELLPACSRASRATVQCPYHAWTYDLDGSLVSAPNMDGVPGFVASEMGLLAVESGVWQGLVWIRLAPPAGGGPELNEFLSPLRELAESARLEELVVARSIDYRVAANWKLIFQNFNECYHCPSVHPALNRLTPFLGSTNDLEAGPILGGPMQLADGCETMSTDGRLSGRVLPGWDEQQRRTVAYYTIFPSLFLSWHPDFVLLHRLTPLAVDQTEVRCEFLFDRESVQDPQFSPDRTVAFWDLTNRQDWEVCESTQRGMQHPAYRPGPYSNLESVVAAFDRYYREMFALTDES